MSLVLLRFVYFVYFCQQFRDIPRLSDKAENRDTFSAVPAAISLLIYYQRYDEKTDFPPPHLEVARVDAHGCVAEIGRAHV